MAICLENLENLKMSGNLTAVREMSGILLKIKEMSGKNLVSEKLRKTVYSVYSVLNVKYIWFRFMHCCIPTPPPTVTVEHHHHHHHIYFAINW